MKNMVKHIGLAAIVAAIAISMTALSLADCDNGSDGDYGLCRGAGGSCRGQIADNSNKKII